MHNSSPPGSLRLSAMLFLLAAFLVPCLTSHAEQPHYTHVFENGRLLDGTGNPWRYADVALVDDRIAFVGKLRADGFTAVHVHDITGHVLTPSFIDVHTHVDGTLHELPQATNFVRKLNPIAIPSGAWFRPPPQRASAVAKAWNGGGGSCGRFMRISCRFFDFFLGIHACCLTMHLVAYILLEHDASSCIAECFSPI